MKTKENRTKGNSAANQRDFILSYLKKNGSGTTQDFRDAGIMSPAPRIMELRRLGYKIRKELEVVTDHVGVTHGHVARYFLQGGGE